MSMNPPGDTPPPPPPPPPPAGGGAPQPAGGGFDIGQAFSWSWKMFQENVQVLLIIGAIIVGIQLAFRLVQSLFNGGFSFNPAGSSIGGNFAVSFAVSLIIPVVTLLAVSLVQLGLIRVTLELTRGNKITLNEAFQTTSWGSYIVASILYALAVIVGLGFCCVGVLVPIVMFAFYGYFVVDKQAGPTEALGASWKLVAGKLGEVILLLLVVLGLTILGAITCGIGAIFTAPFSALLLAFGFKKLQGEPVAGA